MTTYTWSTAQFDEMSWHDNHVHALRVVQGEYGPGKLVLDLDYILEWVACEGGRPQFRILPARLMFLEVYDLRVRLDYATPTAALAPFSIHAIERQTQVREHHEVEVWTIRLSWPDGEISFVADGFEQRGVAPPILCEEQCLEPGQRGH